MTEPDRESGRRPDNPPPVPSGVRTRLIRELVPPGFTAREWWKWARWYAVQCKAFCEEVYNDHMAWANEITEAVDAGLIDPHRRTPGLKFGVLDPDLKLPFQK